MRNLLIFFLCVISLNVSAQEVRRRHAKPTEKAKPAPPIKKSKMALVVVEGAMVYSTASFDAAVISYLPANKKIEVSNKTYGPFYKVKLKKGSFGFISDVDIQIIGAAGSEKGGEKKEAQKEKPKKQDDEIERFDVKRKPIDEVKAIGLNVSRMGYTEELSTGQQPLDNVMAYGIKYSGPNILLPTLMDFNLAMSLGPPAYYQAISSNGTASGYMAFADALLVMPVLSSQDTMVYLGLGPHITYLSAKVTVSNAVQNTATTRLGGEGMLGAGIRMGKFILKIEGKYIYDTKPYYGGTVGIQFAR